MIELVFAFSMFILFLHAKKKNLKPSDIYIGTDYHCIKPIF